MTSVRIQVVSLLSLVGFVCAGVASNADLSPAQLFPRASSGCPTGGQISCHNTTTQTNLCCFESPGVSCCLVNSLTMAYAHDILGVTASNPGKLPVRICMIFIEVAWRSVLGHIRAWNGPSYYLDRSWSVICEFILSLLIKLRSLA